MLSLSMTSLNSFVVLSMTSNSYVVLRRASNAYVVLSITSNSFVIISDYVVIIAAIVDTTLMMGSISVQIYRFALLKETEG